MVTLHKKKEIITPKIKPEVLTYRLSLMDSANRAVQVDVDPKNIAKGVEELMANYKTLLDKEVEYKKESEKQDVEVDKKIKKIHKEKQDALEPHECTVCGKKWKGGSELCPDKECEGSKVQAI